jgi:gas vesicle protein
MDVYTQTRNYGFALGMMTGTVVGVGMMLCLAPRAASEVRRRIADSAKVVGEHASERYRQVGGRLGGALEDLTAKDQSVCDDVADAVARGAHEVERFATAAKFRPSVRQL